MKAVVDCKGDKARELTFSKGEVIVVTREEDEQSWVSTVCHGPPTPLSLHSLPSGACCWVMPHLWGHLDDGSLPVMHNVTPTPPTPPLCTPRLASLKVTAPAPVSSPPASCTSCRTDCIPIAFSIPTGLVAHGVGCGHPQSPLCCHPLLLASGP